MGFCEVSLLSSTPTDKDDTVSFALQIDKQGAPSYSSLMQNARAGGSGKPKKKSFQELFSRNELWHYGTAAVVYIVLGVLFQNAVLNFAVGPLFIVVWMWRIAPLIDRWRARRS